MSSVELERMNPYDTAAFYNTIGFGNFEDDCYSFGKKSLLVRFGSGSVITKSFVENLEESEVEFMVSTDEGFFMEIGRNKGLEKMHRENISIRIPGVVKKLSGL